MNMRTIVLLSIVLAATHLSVSCTTPEELFIDANAQYRSGNFTRALADYQQIPKKNAYVYYNMGNCAFKIKKYGYALLYWRRAEKEWGLFGRDELLENIMHLKEILLKQTGKKLPAKNSWRLMVTKTVNYIQSLMYSIPIFVLQFFFLALWLFLFLYLRFLHKKRQRFIITTLFSLVAFFGIILITRYSFDIRTYGVIVNHNAQLLCGPGVTFQTLLPLPQAKEVIIKKETKDFFKIKVDRRLGWIAKKNVEKI